MLIKCPECELQVSDKALSCPHCGLPMKTTSKPAIRRSNKKRRLPNGFGQIQEIKGRYLRKPFRVSVTVGKTVEGKPIAKLLKPQAYFETYNDAYAALVEYNRNPYDLDVAITLNELYDKWSTEYFERISVSAQRTVKSAWAKCSELYNMRAKDLRARHIKACMDNCESSNMKSRIKSTFNLLLDYAVEYEIVDKNYARTFNVSDDVAKDTAEPKRCHISFTDAELETLWKYKDDRTVRMILIQCYSGWRPQELGLITRDNVNINDWTFTGGMKTAAGKNRIVPIHEKIKRLVQDAYDEGYEYLLTDENGNLMTYDKLRHRVEKVVASLGLNPDHRAHDGRKTFITLAKKYKCDEYAIKYIVGHAITDLTEKVYTERDIQFLQIEISKIK